MLVHLKLNLTNLILLIIYAVFINTYFWQLVETDRKTDILRGVIEMKIFGKVKRVTEHC